MKVKNDIFFHAELLDSHTNFIDLHLENQYVVVELDNLKKKKKEKEIVIQRFLQTTIDGLAVAHWLAQVLVT